ncbi:HD domain-containing protein [Mesobacillus zeae]|uniref:HD domain-containing protein n=1 Tax=Mesobacillus zeae TaxID=1917180 RepID=A0A398B3R3_9BACI|nr:HD domain-containing protein [Mesobacillus zeae]
MMEEIIRNTEDFVRKVLGKDTSGHDWYHIDRVRKNALSICKLENDGNRFIIEMAALLHDIPDEKLNDSEETGWKRLKCYIDSLMLPAEISSRIIDCIDTVSFKGGTNKEPETIEAKIVQDADRLDAMGAIGIARTFAYGGKKSRAIYDPGLPVRESMTAAEYRSGNSSSIHHFYEKLLKLKDRMNTDSARLLAEKRHHVMEDFLEQFYSEWNGKA